ncbi:MarR family transcriptional regulator [Vallitalea pronyensis]|uniref:MarR family transcriptional regulator n=1 Tax=Vallitalea pronyensis TaxID=1348613 RepID=A0A8J8SIT5_9FIRM|nr:MarR family transcriptional regulator [Vallitalea pronyensis]QUI24941.1 MarR family transcriptional regulator [Vallitalea pronyensis]
MQNVIKLYFKSVKMFNELESIPRDFGTGDLLYSSEIHTLVAIGNHPDVNLTELANILDITKGGASKFVKKLLEKALINKKSLATNKKEVLFELTEKGRVAFHGHEKFSQDVFGDIYSTLSAMDASEIKFLESFLHDLNAILMKKK